MVKKATPRIVNIRKTSPRKTKAGYSLSDVEEMEKKALNSANKALSAIENALAVWDASQQKPQDLQIRINRLRYFHDALSNWEKKMLKSMAKRSEVNERMQVLREFSDICYTYR